MRTYTVTVSVGKPFATGEECPACRFDSIHAVLILIQSRDPRFLYVCGRTVCGWKPPRN